MSNPVEISTLFGSESLSYEQFRAKAEAAGAKYADLSGGGYVDKGKYDELNNKHTQATTELTALRAEKKAATDLKEIKKAGVADEFGEFVLSKVSGKVSDSVSLEAATKEYLKEHPQYAKGKKVVKVSSQGGSDGGNAQSGTNARMNAILRGKED